MTVYEKIAGKMLREWRKDSYAFGMDVLGRTGDLAAVAGNSTVLIGGRQGSKKWIAPVVEAVTESLKSKGIQIEGIIDGSAPDSPYEDVYRIAGQLEKKDTGSIIAIGGGSTIDTVKASNILSTLDSCDVEQYFGKGIVTERLEAENKKLPALIAVQTAAGSAAHLTRYSNITDMEKGQKKLIIDDAITPPLAVFDYRTTITAPISVRITGAMDGISHCLEVACGAIGEPFFEKVMEIAETGISLIADNIVKLMENPADEVLTERIGLGTDMGGYSIMTGGTSFGHLLSFSLAGKIPHGRACTIANPYTLVFFAPAIGKQLEMLGNILARNGYIKENTKKYKGRDLGLLVADGMIKLLESVGLPASLGKAGIDSSARERMLAGAKDPQLWTKLEQAPVSLIVRDKKNEINRQATEDNIDMYMGSLIDAILSGDFNKIRNMP